MQTMYTNTTSSQKPTITVADFKRTKRSAKNPFGLKSGSNNKTSSDIFVSPQIKPTTPLKLKSVALLNKSSVKLTKSRTQTLNLMTPDAQNIEKNKYEFNEKTLKYASNLEDKIYFNDDLRRMIEELNGHPLVLESVHKKNYLQYIEFQKKNTNLMDASELETFSKENFIILKTLLADAKKSESIIKSVEKYKAIVSGICLIIELVISDRFGIGVSGLAQACERICNNFLDDEFKQIAESRYESEFIIGGSSNPYSGIWYWVLGVVILVLTTNYFNKGSAANVLDVGKQAKDLLQGNESASVGDVIKRVMDYFGSGDNVELEDDGNAF